MSVDLQGFDDFEKKLGTLSSAAEDGDDVAWVGTWAHYAVYVEFGTSKMKAIPFLRPAINKVSLQLKFGKLVSDTMLDLFNPDHLANLPMIIAENIEGEAKRSLGRGSRGVDTGNLKSSIVSVPEESKLKSESFNKATHQGKMLPD